MHAFGVDAVVEKLRAAGGGYEIVHESAGLELGVYVAPEPDRQQPHEDDEVYVVLVTAARAGRRAAASGGRAPPPPARALARPAGLAPDLRPPSPDRDVRRPRPPWMAGRGGDGRARVRPRLRAGPPP